MASSTINAISLQTIMEKAQHVHGSLTTQFDLSSARNRAREIYQDGIRLVMREVKGDPLFTDIVLPVIIQLGETLPLENIQLQFSLLYSLSKAYRLFVELTWHQCLRDRTPIRAESIAKIKKVIDQTMATIPRNSPAIRFELKCTKEASKWFDPAEGISSKYLKHTGEAIGAAASLKPGKIFSTLKNLFVDIRADLKNSWYVDAYIWRWMSEEVTTREELQQTISPDEAKDWKDKGGRYTVCITLIFMKIIKNQEADQGLRQLAFKGDGNYPGLLDMLSLESRNTATNLLAHPVETLKKIARKPDRFWPARHLAIQYLTRLSKKEHYALFRDESQSALKSRMDAFSGSKARYQEEKSHLASALGEITANKEAAAAAIKEGKDEYDIQNSAQGIVPNTTVLLQITKRILEAEENHKDLTSKEECANDWMASLCEIERAEEAALQAALPL